MVTMNTKDLTGPALRYAVAIAIGLKVERLEEGDYKPGEPHWWRAYDEARARVAPKSNGLVGYIQPTRPSGIYAFIPDLAWEVCGPLISKYKVWLSPPVGNPDPEDNDGWDAEIYTEDGQEDPAAHIIGCATAQIAICRSVVGRVLGATVDIPEELAA